MVKCLEATFVQKYIQIGILCFYLTTATPKFGMIGGEIVLPRYWEKYAHTLNILKNGPLFGAAEHCSDVGRQIALEDKTEHTYIIITY